MALGVFQLAIITFHVDSAGTWSSRVDWNGAANDINTALVRGRCSMEQILLEAGSCSDTAAVIKDYTTIKPSSLSTSLPSGDYTLVILNGGPASDTAAYRLEGPISGVSAAATSPARRTQTFSFSLPQGSTASVLAGPIRAGSGPLDVQLAYAGTFRILACVGTSQSCMPMGGAPQTRSYLVPDELPAGNLQATVYFTPGATQPAGAATGTVSFTYSPLP